MTRLYVVVGLTESNFVRDFLTSHLERLSPGGLEVHAPNLKGYRTYAEVRKLIVALLGNPAGEVLVTTMIDVFKLAGDFPGRATCDSYEDPWKRVEELERSFHEDVSDRRFIPYLQLHEFEALILTDARCLAKYYPKRKNDLARLAESVTKHFKSPEQVNQVTPPSARIRTVVPEYQKVLFGVSAVIDLGIERIRTRCQHFDSWLRKLEGLF